MEKREVLLVSHKSKALALKDAHVQLSAYPSYKSSYRERNQPSHFDVSRVAFVSTSEQLQTLWLAYQFYYENWP